MTATIWLALAGAAAAELVLPPGFTAEPYVSGQGFEGGGERGVPGIPSTATLDFDVTGALYLARTGARFRGGEVDDLLSVYRIPPGGARLTPSTEARFLHGPPLRNPQVALVRGRGEVLVTTYDRDRKLGALYRMLDGRPTLLAGGTPPAGQPPALRLPEGAAVDASGAIYVADREANAVVRLDPTGRVTEPRYVEVGRPRWLALDTDGRLWVAADGTAEQPWQDGIGEIWRVDADRQAHLVLKGPLAAAIESGPGGTLLVAQRRANQVFALTPEGRRIELAQAREGTAIRSLAISPITPETRRAGIAGQLFLVVVSRQLWALNEVWRVAGPLEEFLRRAAAAP